MFSPEDQQIEICLLKSSLQEIENDLVVQRGTLPALDAENEQQYRETMTALRVARSLNAEMERLKQENVRLLAKRMQLKRQCEDISQSIEQARVNRNLMMNLLQSEDDEEENIICKYEDCLKEKAERFRKARLFYSEEDINNEINNIEAVNSEMAIEVEQRESNVDELKAKLYALTTDVPDNLLDILGKKDFEVKVKEATQKCEELQEKLKNLNLIK